MSGCLVSWNKGRGAERSLPRHRSVDWVGGLVGWEVVQVLGGCLRCQWPAITQIVASSVFFFRARFGAFMILVLYDFMTSRMSLAEVRARG